MRINTEDKSLERNYQSKRRFLVKEYEGGVQYIV